MQKFNVENRVSFGWMNILILVFLNVFCFRPAVAGTAAAELDKTVGTTEDQFQLVIAITGSYDGDAPLIEIPGVEVVNGGVSRNMQWTNGKYSSEIQFSYIIIANSPGRFQVPSVKIKVDKQEVSTLPIGFEVRGIGQGQGQANSGGQPGANPSKNSTEAENQGSTDTGAKGRGDVFIERELSKSNPYAGEGVMSTVRVFHRVRLTGGTPQRESAPDFRFIPVPGEKNFQQIIGGVRYGVIELKEVAVPLRAGDLSLPPFGLNAVIVVPVAPRSSPGSVWDMLQGGAFGMGREVQKKVFSQTTPLKVKPIPEQGKPEGFSGLVGDFRLKGSVSKSTIAAGETVTITLLIDGEGLLEALGEVKVANDSIGKVYADKPVSDVSFTGDVIRSKRELKYALVPQRAGTYDLGPVVIPFFNTKSGVYEELRADLGTLVVSGSAPGSAADISAFPAAKSSVKLLGNDLLEQHSASLLAFDQSLSKKVIFLFSSVALSSWVFGLGVLGYRGFRSKLDGDGVKARRSAAQKRFLKKVKAAEKLTATDARAAVVQVRSAFYDFVGDKLNVSASAMTTKEILELIEKAGGTGQTEALKVVKDIERLEYGGSIIDMSAALQVSNSAASAVAVLERKI